MKNLLIMDLFQDWADELTITRNVRPQSISYYKQKIECFVRYSWENYIDILGNAFAFKKAYFRFARSPLADSTKSKVWATLSQFGEWLRTNDITLNNAPKILGKPPKIKYPEIQILTRDEIERLYSVLADVYGHSQNYERNVLIFETFLYSGIRHKELLDLQKVDIYPNFIHVRDGKGGKARRVGVPEFLAEKLLQFTKHLRNDDFVFTGGSPAVRGTTRLVSAIFKRLSERSGIKLFPHKLRHTYATQCLAAGIDIHVLQRQLGHEDIKMSIRYVHIADSIRFDKIQKFVHYRFREPNFFKKSVKMSEVVRAFDALDLDFMPRLDDDEPNESEKVKKVI